MEISLELPNQITNYQLEGSYIRNIRKISFLVQIIMRKYRHIFLASPFILPGNILKSWRHEKGREEGRALSLSSLRSAIMARFAFSFLHCLVHPPTAAFFGHNIYREREWTSCFNNDLKYPLKCTSIGKIVLTPQVIVT